MNDLRQLNITYAKRNIVDSIWKEANLEGIKATFPDTQEIYEGRTVAGLSVEGTVAINNLKHAWWMTLDKLDSPLDILYVKELHQKIGAGIISYAGELRKQSVYITGTSYQPPIPSDEDLDSLLDQINSIDNGVKQALTAFAKFAKSQFFIDGNKRVAQLVANKLLINSCSGIFTVPIEEKHNFGKHLVKFYEDDNLIAFTNYLKNTCLDDVFLSTSRTKNIDKSKPVHLSPSEKIAQGNARAEKYNESLNPNTPYLKHKI